MVTVYHAPQTRSLRVLWTLEELGLAADRRPVKFPPRQHQPDYVALNPAGTVPVMVDGAVTMAESVAICEYVVERHGPSPLAVAPGEPSRADYLQWLWYGEGTLTLPVSVILRLGRIQGAEAAVAPVLAEARETFAARLAALERRLEAGEHLAAGRFTLADISCGYALYLAGLRKLDSLFGPRVAAYLARLQARPAYQRALAANNAR
jgi:glutathione S-transferase